MAAAPQCSAIIFRGYRAEVERRGHLPVLLERVRPQTRALLERPPLAIGWVDYDDMNQLFEAMGTVMTRDEVRDAGFRSAKDGVGPIIAPMIRGTLALFGASPAGLFGNLGRITALVLKQTTFTFRSTGARSGEVEILNPIPMAPMLFVGWEGAFLFGFDVLGLKGEVGEAQVHDGGLRSTIAISW